MSVNEAYLPLSVKNEGATPSADYLSASSVVRNYFLPDARGLGIMMYDDRGHTHDEGG